MSTAPHTFWILRFSSLGDIIVTTAALTWIKTHFPQSKIYYVTSQEYRDLFSADPRITEVITFDRTHTSGGHFLRFLYQDLFPKMRAEGGVIVDFHNTLRAKLLKVLAPLPTDVTIQKYTLRRLLLCLTKINLLKTSLPLAQRLCHQLSTTWAIPSTAAHWRPRLHPSSSIRESLQRQFEAQQPYIAIAPVAQWPGKCWPIAHFARLIQMIQRQTPYRCLIFGTSRDSAARQLTQLTDALSLVGQLSLSETLSMFHQFCKMVIANDTGLMHMADALDIPTCAILGPTTPQMGYPPLGTSSFIVEQPMWCRPCSRTGQTPCIRWGRRPCLTTLTPEHVFTACAQQGWWNHV